MDRGILVGNRICAKRADQQRQARHLEKVNRMKPDIDNSLPVAATLPHLRNNLKREQILEDTYTDIDRSNRILLQKMSDIMRKPSFVLTSAPDKKASTSLNRDSRRKELQRITNENLSILRRIQGVQPLYDHVRWEQEFRRTRSYLKNKCEYPVILGSISSNKIKQEQPDSNLAIEDEGMDLKTYMNNPGSKIKESAKPSPVRYLVKEGKRIGDTFYLIEISIEGECLIINAYSGYESNGGIELRLAKSEHEKLLREVGGEYAGIVDKIRIKNGALYLI
jgi:hypothetical protein